MNNNLVLYFDDYLHEEEDLLRRLGIDVLRASMGSSVDLLHQFKGYATRHVLVRANKLSPYVYEDLCVTLMNAGIAPRTDSSSYSVLCNSEAYESYVSMHVPDMETWPLLSPSLVQDLNALRKWGRLFIKSELGSAAKFAGLNACFIERFSESEIRERIDTLRRSHPSAQRLIARSVVAVRQIDGCSVEGRFVVLNGVVSYLDHCEVGNKTFRDEFFRSHITSANSVTEKLRRGGISGDYFLDIAEKKEGGWFVVEIKPLLNGTIRCVNQFACELAKQC